MVAESACRLRRHLEPQSRQVQLIDKHVNHANCAFFSDVIVDAFGKQGGLIAVFAFDESTLGGCPLPRKFDYISKGVFTQLRLEADEWIESLLSTHSNAGSVSEKLLFTVFRCNPMSS